MNTVVYEVNRTCVLQPFSGDKVDWIRLQLCSLVVGTMRSAAIDRNVAIQSDSIVEKTILIQNDSWIFPLSTKIWSVKSHVEDSLVLIKK